MSMLNWKGGLLLGALLLAGACSDGMSEMETDGSLTGTGDAGASCELDAPGAPFRFIVRNVGERDLGLNTGCWHLSLPIFIDTEEGERNAGVTNNESCTFDCLELYEGGGSPDGYCSDCGPGTSKFLAPGETRELDWDRRVFDDVQAPAECVPNSMVLSCSLGTRLPDTGTVTGRLRVCAPGNQHGYYCFGDDSFDVPLTIDLGADELVIEVE
jgi:hypothetical protein